MSAKKVLLADVLWRAANEKLIAPADGVPYGKDWYSCNAVALALGYECIDDMWGHPAVAFLEDLGCNTHTGLGFRDLGNFGSEREQGARYMWLLLAMHVAADEKVKVRA